MAATGGVDAKELELVIKGLLISSPTVITANTLERECKNELGYVFPYRKLGFASFLDYLRSIPTVVQLQPPNGYNPQVLPITTKASSHIDQLVSKQRVAPSRRRGVSRRGGYNSRPPPARRRPTGPPAPPPVRPNQGIDVRDLENHLRRNYDERDLARNGVHGVEDLLSRGDHMLERGDTKVYPKLAHEFNNPNQNGRANIMPAGFEDDFDDFDYDDDYYEGNDSEEEMSNQVIQIWSQVLGVEENNSSSRPQKPQGNMPNGSQEEESLHYDNQEFPEDDFNISEAMINNFRTILSRHPDGIWASQLQMYYHDYFGATLDFSDLGHNSAISLVASLPTVFTYCREGTHDWKLYDARLVSQEDLDAKVNGSATMSQEKDRYIPQTIIENIKRLLEENINGFRSTDLLSLYSRTFNKALNLDILGFDTLEEFLMILKNDVTLKKSSGYHVLLPKHKLVPHDALLPPKPDDRLNVPAESLGVPIPDFVMKLGDEILMQELPQIMSKDDDTMLMVLDVRVAEVHSPAFFYVMLDQMYEELEKMMDDLDKFYNLEEANLKIPVPYMAPNLYCAALYCGYWHRVKITKIKNPNAVEIEYIDYGTPATVDSSELRYLSKEYVYLPAQAICSKLLGIKPLDGATKFPEPVCAKFLSLVEGKRLVAYVYHLQEREKLQIEVVLYDVEPNKEMVINDHLVEIGMAMPIDQIVIGTTDLAKTEEIQPQATDDQMVPPQGSAESPAPPSSDSPLPAYLPKLLENASASRPTPSRTYEESKPFRPPPGFEEIPSSPAQSFFDLSMPPASAASMYPTTNQSNSVYDNITENDKLRVKDFFKNNKDFIPRFLQEEQLRKPNMCQANPSNMPFYGPPLFQNGPQPSFTYSSVIPPAGYFPYPLVPMVPPGFFHTLVPTQYIPVPVPLNIGQGDALMLPPLVQSARHHSPSPISTTHPHHTIPSSVYSPPPCPTFTDTSRTGSAAERPVSASSSMSEPIQVNQIPRPATPLTPASVEVANICKMSRTQSSASLNSAGRSTNSHHSASPVNVISSNSQSNTIIDSTLREKQDSTNLLDNISPSDSTMHPQLNINFNEIPLPPLDEKIIQYSNLDSHSSDLLNTKEQQTNILVNNTPLLPEPNSQRNSQQYSSSERLFSAASSPVDMLMGSSPRRGELSDEYASASENLDEDQRQLANLTLTGHNSVLATAPQSEDIPDSWENLDLDDTPAKAANFNIDFSQALDLIMKDMHGKKMLIHDPVEKSVSENKEEQLKLHIPVNWKDAFNPDTLNFIDRIDNNNKEKIQSPSPPKFNVTNVPVQVVECQKKRFHLLQLNNTPAVVALEFFKQFSNTSPLVSEKVIEVKTSNLMYYINKVEFPIVLNELNKITDFSGGLSKKTVIRLNKVRVLNLSDIPKCLQVLNITNQSLVEDLKTIANELASCCKTT